MGNELLVKVYDVGFGDCIYVCIPDNDSDFHMLIDCGTKGVADPTLKNALDNLKTMLPVDQATAGTAHPKKCLDLLVVTHPHADHIRGFDPQWFKDIKIKFIWMSAFMKKDHPQARAAHTLQDISDRAAHSLLERGLSLSGELEAHLLNSIWNPGAMDALRGDGPKEKHLDSTASRLYVARDVYNILSVADRNHYRLSFEKGTTYFTGFNEDKTCIRILAPEWDIDTFYSGEGTDAEDIQVLNTIHKDIQAERRTGKKKKYIPFPINISQEDFRLLRHRLLYSAMAFSPKDEELKNNTSVVFLLEWRGKRLLFTGDAEWKGKKVKQGESNGCWDVLLMQDEQHGHLAKPIDYLKVSHHGSVNGTPFFDEEGAEQPILDNMLPKDKKAQIVISTDWKKYRETNKVPYPELVKEFGRRAANRCKYPDDPDLPNDWQPVRTDLEKKDIDTIIKKAPD